MVRSSFIDLFRGLTLLEMQTTEVGDSKFFDHAEYDEMNMSYADTIFPCFSFISGMTMKPNRYTPIRKNLQLIGLGIAYNAMPMIMQNDYSNGLRFLGVLQRHGLSSIVLNLMPSKIRDSSIFPMIMTGLWFTTSVVLAKDKSDPFTAPQNTVQLTIDFSLFGSRTYHIHYDPEGILGTLMTAVTIWSGYWFNQQNYNNATSIMIGLGSFLTGKLLAYVSPLLFPISKPLWTPAFVLTSNGSSILKSVLLKLSLPYLPETLTNCLSLYGRLSMEVYFLGEFLMILLKTPWADKKSFWEICKENLNYFLPSFVTSTVLAISFNAVLMSMAHYCDINDLKIRFF